MAVALGTKGTGEAGSGDIDTGTITIASGEALIVCVELREDNAVELAETDITAVWDPTGVNESLTRHAFIENGRTHVQHFIHNTPTAKSAIVRVTVAAAYNSCRVVAFPVSGQSGTPFGTSTTQAFGNSTSVSNSVSSEVNGLVVDTVVLGGSASNLAADTGQTEKDNDFIGPSQNIPVGVSEEQGAASVTMGWTWTTGRNGGHVMTPIAPAAGAEELGAAELDAEALSQLTGFDFPPSPNPISLLWVADGVQVTFTDQTSGRRKHRVQRRLFDVPGRNWIPIATLAAGVTTHTDTTAEDIDYQYQVCALNSCDDLHEEACGVAHQALVNSHNYKGEALLNVFAGRDYSVSPPALTAEALLNMGFMKTINAQLGLDAEAILQVFGQFIAEEIGEVMMIAEALMQTGIAVDRSQAYEMIGEALLPNPAFVFNIPYALKAESQMQVEFFVCEGWEDLLAQTVTYTDLTSVMATWIQHQCSSQTVTWADLIRFDGEC